MTHCMNIDSTPKRLSAEYETLKSCYQTMKREYQKNGSMIEINEPQNSLSNVFPEPFPESIFKEFENEVKVAGIRAARERLLLEKFEYLQTVVKEMVSKHNGQMKEVESQLNYFKETIMKMNQEHALKCDNLQTVISRKEIELQKVRKELKQMSEKLKITKDENQSLITRHEVELNSFLKRCEDEMIKIKETADANCSQLRNERAEEKRKLLQDLTVARASLKEERNRRLHIQKLEGERSQAESTVNEELMDRIHALETTLGSLKIENSQLNDEIQSLYRQKEEYLQAETRVQREMKDRHENELKEIEDRIKSLITSQEHTLNVEKARTLKAEKRATELERCIKRLENGV